MSLFLGSKMKHGGPREKKLILAWKIELELQRKGFPSYLVVP